MPLPRENQEEDDDSSSLEDTAEDQELPLSTQIIRRYEKSQFDPGEKVFLPAGSLEDLLTEEAIIKELHGDSRVDLEDRLLRPENQRVVEFIIRQDAKKVFAITVINEFRGEDLKKAMRVLKKINLTDKCLPVQEEFLGEQLGKYSKIWTPVRIHHFCREQWCFLSPVFSPQQTMFYLEPNHILPFTEKSSGCDVQEGAFSQVFCIKIHPAHLIEPVKDVGSLYNPFNFNEIKLISCN